MLRNYAVVERMICLRPVRKLLKFIGAIIAFIVVGLAWMIGYLAYESHRVGAISKQFKPGMTVEEAVAVFPTDFFSASIGVPSREGSCKNTSGAISPPEEAPVLFPEMEDGDAKGKELAWDAAQIPLRLDRFELLDKHLRERKNWSILIQAWTAYIQNSEHPEAIAYCQRGSAYLVVGDFIRGYEDTKKSCQLGYQECCTDLRKLPREKVSAVEAKEKRIADDAPFCEPPAASFSMIGPVADDKFNLRINAPTGKGDPTQKTVSRAEFAELLNGEFRGREWGVGFTYMTATPEHLSFSFVVGRDGKLKEISRLRGWE